MLGTAQFGQESVPNTATWLAFPGGITATIAYARAGYRQLHLGQPAAWVPLDPFDDTGLDPSARTGRAYPAQDADRWYYITLQHPATMVDGDTMTMTITLNRPVQGFSLTLTQVDSLAGQYDDEVTLRPGGYAVTSQGAAVEGDGSTTPFHSSSPGSTASPDHDVSVEWVDSAQQFVVSFRVGSRGDDSQCGQWMGVGNFAINGCG
jgi:hypothetical protein